VHLTHDGEPRVEEQPESLSIKRTTSAVSAAGANALAWGEGLRTATAAAAVIRYTVRQRGRPASRHSNSAEVTARQSAACLMVGPLSRCAAFAAAR